MAAPLQNPSTDGGPRGAPPPGSIGPPPWVRAFGAIAALLFAVFVALHLRGGGFGHHGSAPPPPDGVGHGVVRP
jgi:hypothetical protein